MSMQKECLYWSHLTLCNLKYAKFEHEQLKLDLLKKVFLEVDGSFPSCRRRLRVLSANSSLFSPLEFACQKLELKANQINAVLNDSNEIRPLDVKGLQLLLQGAVMPTVNAGPLSYAEAFTQPEQKKRYGDDGMHVLELSFRKLMSACDKALQVNETVIAADQQTYHEVLLASFEAMHERLSGFFGNSCLRIHEFQFRDVQPQEGIADGQKSAMRVLHTISGVTPTS
uniref:DOCKER domain-containing protein n=1 Tax=Angiostrongylus cantonensis TaxID=6313 RepID=A0A0K0DPL1_ANGCA